MTSKFSAKEGTNLPPHNGRDGALGLELEEGQNIHDARENKPWQKITI